MSAPTREGEGKGGGGIGLHWRVWEAEAPRGRLLLLHGLGEHSGRYGDFAGYLARKGFSVFSFDLRGHGLSQGPRGDAPAFSAFLDDLRAMEETMDGELPQGGGTFFMGHSMGGLLALRRLREGSHPFQGAVISAPWLQTALPRWLRALGRWIGGRFPGFSFPSGTSPGRLSRDPEIMERWRKDPLNHQKVTGRLFLAAEDLQAELLSHPGATPIPLLFLIPGADRVVDPRATEEFARGIVGRAVDVEILEGRAHEPLNDLGREEVYELVASWLLDQSPRQPRREDEQGPC